MLGATALALMLLARTTRAESFTLNDLIARGGSIVQGDKLFGNFSYTATGDMPTAQLVNVTGVTVDGNFGIEFQGAFQDVAGGGASDALIHYTVTVLDPTMVITDAHLISNVVGFGAPFTGFGTVSETFLPKTSAFLTNFNIDNTVFKLSDSYVWGLPGYTSLNVQKDIALTATSGIIGLSFVDQTFSQTQVVPVPAAIWGGVSLLGLMGGGRLWKRRRELA